MKLWFLHNPKIFDRPTFCPESNETLFVPLNWRASQALTAAGQRALLPQDLLKNDVDVMDRRAWEFSAAWYREDGGEDPTCAGGTSFGHALDVHAWNSLIGPTVKNFLIALRAIDQAKPDAVFFDEGVPGSLKESVRVVSKSFSFLLDGQANPHVNQAIDEGLGESISWSRQTPRVWRDRFLKAVFNEMARVVRAVSKRSPEKKILMGYYPTQHALFSRIVSPPLRPDIQWEMTEWPPRDLALKFMANGIPIADVLSPPLRRHREKAVEILGCWRQWVSRPGFSDRFLVDGISIWPALEKGLDSLLSTYLPLLLVRLEKADRLFRHSRYLALVTPFDSMPESRILVGQARQQGVPVVLAAHGIGFIHGGDKGEGMQANVVAPPGPAVGAQYKAAGVPSEHVWPVGAGLMDDYAPRPESPPMDLRRRVLVLTNPALPFSMSSGPGFEERYLITVLNVLRRFQGLSITVKLHPSESVDYYRQVLEESGFRGMEIFKKEPFPEVLANHGTVIGAISTALIQAMVRRCWVMSANVMGFPFPPPFNESCGFPVARTPDALEAWLTSVLSSTPPSTDYEPLLSDYAGPLDGRESERFLAQLEKFCGGTEPLRAGH